MRKKNSFRSSTIFFVLFPEKKKSMCNEITHLYIIKTVYLRQIAYSQFWLCRKKCIREANREKKAMKKFAEINFMQVTRHIQTCTIFLMINMKPLSV